jgi:hypothetical protein
VRLGGKAAGKEPSVRADRRELITAPLRMRRRRRVARV